MLVHQIFAQIHEEEVKKVIVCDNYEYANYLARATYDDTAFAVDCTQYPCGIGDKYKDGCFLREALDEEGHPTGEFKIIEYVPTAEQEIPAIKEELSKASEEIRIAQQQSIVLARAASFTAVTFTDEQALQVPELYSVWSPDGVSYKIGERIRYNDVLYKVLTDHTSQESWKPDVSPSLFTKVLIPDPEVIPDWEQPTAENAYMTGDKVKHKGKVWESLVDNNVWEPGVIGTEGQWKEVEA